MEDKKTDYFFFSGKGGAGKSSMSSATAVKMAEEGYDTLIVSTDPAPNLSEIFEQDIGEEPEGVEGVENLSAVELDPDSLTEDFKEKLLEKMEGDLPEDELEEIGDALDTPCTDEIAAFDAFSSFLSNSKFDKVIMDTAPTGNTLQLLESPFEWIQEIENNADTCIGPATSLTSEKEEYKEAIDILRSEKASFIFVMRPSRSSLTETEDAVSKLASQGFNIQELIINGFTPEKLKESEFYEGKYDREKEIMKKVEGLEVDQISKVPLLPREIKGVERVKEVAGILFEDEEPDYSVDTDEESMDYDFDRDEVLSKIKGSENLFITGKGGSGKTTSAAAIAEYAADKGLNTLLVSVYSHRDIEHFYGELSGKPKEIDENLDAVKVDRNSSLKHLRDSKVEEMKEKFEDSDFSFDEEATLDKINEQLKSPCAAEKAIKHHLVSLLQEDYDLKIFDMDPTGDALKIIDKLVNSDQRDMIQESSAFGIVTFPEKSPVAEAFRTVKYLSEEYSLNNSFLIVNYLLPEAENDFMKTKKSEQVRYLKDLEKNIDRPTIGIYDESNKIEDRENIRQLIE